MDLFHLQKMETAALVRPPECVETGALRCVLRFAYRYRNSEILQDVILYAHSLRIDSEPSVDWHEDHRLLKAAFPVNVRATKASYDIQFGHVEHPARFNTRRDYARFKVVGYK